MLIRQYEDEQKQGNYQNGKQKYGAYNNNSPRQAPTIVAKELPAQYVDAAEQVIAKMNEVPDQRRIITTTKIRKLFRLFIDLFNEIKRSDSDALTEAQNAGIDERPCQDCI